MTSTTLNGMPTSLLAGLSLLLLAGAVVCWRTKSVPPHATLGILVLALILARKFVEDQAPTVSTVLFYLNLALAGAAVRLWWRWRRGNAA
jgi:cytochrome b561